MDIKQVAETAFRVIAPTDTPYMQTAATIFLVAPNGELLTITEYPDVYLALETVTQRCADLDAALPGQPLTTATAIGVITCGWAAPAGDHDDIPPSVHPSRRRVRLVLVVDRGLATGSIIGFQDDPDKLVYDDGRAQGALCDAAQDAMRAINRHSMNTAPGANYRADGI